MLSQSAYTPNASATPNKSFLRPWKCIVTSTYSVRRKKRKKWLQRSTKEMTIYDMQVVAVQRFPPETKKKSAISKWATYA